MKKKHKRKAHTAKFERCVMDVKSKDGKYNPWAVCTKSLKGHVFKRKLKKVV